MANAKDIVLRFTEHINRHDVDSLCKLMSEEHRFVDALGAVIQGREQMRQGWIGYFSLVPDFRITFEEIFEEGDDVAAFGTAGGTYSPDGELLEENAWQVPAAWRATVFDNLIAEWRVFTDNEPLRKLMAKASRR